MDIWREPPGGLTQEQRRERRGRRRRRAIASLVVVAVALTGGRAALLGSRPVSEADVLREFRAAARADESLVENVSDPKADRGPGASLRRKRFVSRERDSETTTRVEAPVAAETGSGNVGRGPTPVAAPKEESAPTRPREGVYTWAVEGYEETSGGMSRELPRRSHRIVTHGNRSSWLEHHVFSDKREAWFEVAHMGSTIVTDAVRNRVEFSPVVVDRTVVFDPPVVGARLPHRLNESWSGRWRGRTDGEYDARVFQHTYITIAGEKVEVWGTEVAMQMRGEVEGEVLTRSWVAPKYALVVKQYQRMSVESGPGGYQMEWSGQVTSLTPAR